MKPFFETYIFLLNIDPVIRSRRSLQKVLRMCERIEDLILIRLKMKWNINYLIKLGQGYRCIVYEYRTCTLMMIRPKNPNFFWNLLHVLYNFNAIYLAVPISMITKGFWNLDYKMVNKYHQNVLTYKIFYKNHIIFWQNKLIHIQAQIRTILTQHSL